jgi:hypothetical protein
MSFCIDELFQKISSILMTHESNDVLDNEALDMLASASLIAINILKNSDKRCLVWPNLLQCVIGEQFWAAGQARCVRLQALGVILETLERTSAGSEALVSGWACSELDAIIIRCLNTLCFRTETESGPGILEAARLASVTKLALPLGPSALPSPSGRKGVDGQQRLSLLSEQALLQLTNHIVVFLRAAARKQPAQVEGRAMAVNEAAGAAALDVAESLILSSSTGVWKTPPGAHGGGAELLGDVVEAVFGLVGHSDQARLTAEYHHGPSEGARLRSRLGCRATEVWVSCGRDAQVRRPAGGVRVVFGVECDARSPATMRVVCMVRPEA